MTPKTLIIRTAGTNCDAELAHAFRTAGAEPVTLHLNQLLADPAQFEAFQLIGFPGGFSYGDDIAAGRIFANRLRHGLLAPLQAAVARGVPMIGICNGFQVLVKLGLLPHPVTATQTTTLADNTSGRFIDRWVPMTVNPESPCVWTRGLVDDGTTEFELPIAHGEGRFSAPDDVLDGLEAHGQVALRYAEDVNGSDRSIAGVCDPTGRVLGLMPHPERFTTATHHPAWTRLAHADPTWLTQTPPGLRIFESAVAAVRSCQTSAVGG
ncbi:MAG: phosphoribosylformylglycinamidine synthase subunit PurQ [Planctomycetota bacterium]